MNVANYYYRTSPGSHRTRPRRRIAQHQCQWGTYAHDQSTFEYTLAGRFQNDRYTSPKSMMRDTQ